MNQQTNTKNWQKVVEEAAAEAEAKAKIAEANAVKEQQEQANSESEEENSLTYSDRDELVDKLTAAEKLVEQYKNKWLSAEAEIKNLHQRAERDLTNAHKYAVEKIAVELLTVVDNLERCLENKVAALDIDKESACHQSLNNVYIGVELTLKMFLDVLQKFSITAINPIGEAFNHRYHNAMQMRDDSSVASNTVLQVVQKGYMLKDRLLRPAMVIVSK